MIAIRQPHRPLAEGQVHVVKDPAWRTRSTGPRTSHGPPDSSPGSATGSAHLSGPRAVRLRRLRLRRPAAHRLPLRVVTEKAWHALFARCLFLRPTAEQLRGRAGVDHPHACPTCTPTPPSTAPSPRRASPSDFEPKLVLIVRHPLRRRDQEVGLHGAQLPAAAEGRLPDALLGQHRAGPGDVALFFGLSGTGKTTLSADPERAADRRRRARLVRRRRLQHRGRLLRQDDPLSPPASRRSGTRSASAACWRTWSSTRHARGPTTTTTRSPRTRAPPTRWTSSTTRMSGVGGHPTNIFFLTCDAFGVLPPLAQLTPEQAVYHFLCGYTAKVAGTEAGVTEPKPRRSAPASPRRSCRCRRRATPRCSRRSWSEHRVPVWLVNTGWTGKKKKGPPQRAGREGATHPLKGLKPNFSVRPIPYSDSEIPNRRPGRAQKVLRPRNAWNDKTATTSPRRDPAERDSRTSSTSTPKSSHLGRLAKAAADRRDLPRRNCDMHAEEDRLAVVRRRRKGFRGGDGLSRPSSGSRCKASINLSTAHSEKHHE